MERVMLLAHPYWLLILVLLPIPWLIARKRGYLGFSRVRLMDNASSGRYLVAIPTCLLIVGFIALATALSRPQSVHVVTNETFRSRDILIGVDISGSMAGNYGKIPPSVVGETELDQDFPGRP